MRHRLKSLDVFFPHDSVRECLDSISILEHRRKQTIWNADRRTVLGVQHGRVSRYGGRERGVGKRR